MNAQAHEILLAAMSLSPEDRWLVADLLYGSLASAEDQVAIDHAWDQEVASRVLAVDIGEETLLGMDEIERRFREKGVLWE